jgi:hypothetical protein
LKSSSQGGSLPHPTNNSQITRCQCQPLH